jgi:enoyl-CoA hydratase/carnithine racemase
MGTRLTEIVESIAVGTAVGVVVLTGAGQRAFSVGSDLRQRKNMTKEDWLRQRQAFDRTLYTVRQLRKPIFAAVNGIPYGGGSELAQPTQYTIASDKRHLRPARGDDRAGRRRRLAGVPAAPALPGKGAADAHDRRPDHRR